MEGAPIVSTECHCNSCRAAGARLQALPSAPPFLEAQRRDALRALPQGSRPLRARAPSCLKEFRLTPAAKTRRVVATCCNTPVFLEFQSGHWLSLYGGLWPEGTLPPLDLRTMTSDLPAGTPLPDDVPNGKRQSFSFFAKLLGAWIAMGFRSPKIAFVNGEIHA